MSEDRKNTTIRNGASKHSAVAMTTSSTTPTELVHLTYEGNFQLECTSAVLACHATTKQVDEQATPTDKGTGSNSNDNGDANNVTAVEVQLDKTTMHPQGGGQPTDIGCISCDGITAQIEKVTIDRETGVVTHAGKMTGTIPFEVGKKVHVQVDADRRRILSECHTAGHVVDSAIARCDHIMPPTKGYHFLDGPYVEYKGTVPPDEREELLRNLKMAFQELVEEDIPTTIETLPKDKAEELCNRLAQNFVISDYTDAEEVRVATVAGWACPCGGTHVKSTADLKERKWGVLGIKCKKGVVRVRYGPNAD